MNFKEFFYLSEKKAVDPASTQLYTPHPDTGIEVQGHPQVTVSDPKRGKPSFKTPIPTPKQRWKGKKKNVWKDPTHFLHSYA